ncbi:MAG: phosphodiester glycosidase family protein [Gemmatimonadetes bacterium]|nr:phosphodiester glycosidase family protein [Gemmatimonadota bacterium]
MTRWWLVIAALPVAASAQRSRVEFLPTRFVETVTDVAPGVQWRHMTSKDFGPWVVDLVSIDLAACGCELRHVRAKDSLVAREKVSEMVARQPEGAARVLAAINADFFDVNTGENENNQVIDGEWWKGVRVTDSPYDTFDNPHAQFAIGADGKPRMDRYVFDGAVYINARTTFPLTALNHLESKTLEATVLYTGRIGTTPQDTVRVMAEVPLRVVSRRNDSTVYVIAGPPTKVGGNVIPSGGAVLAAYGPRSKTLAAFKPGDSIAIVLSAASLQADLLRPAPRLFPRLLIGGWPRILSAGQLAAVRAPWDEGTLSSNAEARHPRSAIGFSRDSSTVYLVTVDGRSETSVGMTLRELALFMGEYRSWNALNFDGGGSTALVVKGSVVNKPSDATGERAVGNALIVVARP